MEEKHKASFGPQKGGEPLTSYRKTSFFGVFYQTFKSQRKPSKLKFGNLAETGGKFGKFQVKLFEKMGLEEKTPHTPPRGFPLEH